LSRPTKQYALSSRQLLSIVSAREQMAIVSAVMLIVEWPRRSCTTFSDPDAGVIGIGALLSVERLNVTPTWSTQSTTQSSFHLKYPA
jgi:hypothetical protein